MRKIKHTQIIKELRQYIEDNYRTASEAAESWGIHRSYLSAMIKNKRPIIDDILIDLGYERVQPEAYYRKVYDKPKG